MVLFASSLFAFENGNKVYTSRDGVVKRLDRLASMAGGGRSRLIWNFAS